MSNKRQPSLGDEIRRAALVPGVVVPEEDMPAPAGQSAQVPTMPPEAPAQCPAVDGARTAIDAAHGPLSAVIDALSALIDPALALANDDEQSAAAARAADREFVASLNPPAARAAGPLGLLAVAEAEARAAQTGTILNQIHGARPRRPRAPASVVALKVEFRVVVARLAGAASILDRDWAAYLAEVEAFQGALGNWEQSCQAQRDASERAAIADQLDAHAHRERLLSRARELGLTIPEVQS
jgi:hypothetical protein